MGMTVDIFLFCVRQRTDHFAGVGNNCSDLPPR
jgi:hypothetical protein